MYMQCYWCNWWCYWCRWCCSCDRHRHWPEGEGKRCGAITAYLCLVPPTKLRLLGRASSKVRAGEAETGWRGERWERWGGVLHPVTPAHRWSYKNAEDCGRIPASPEPGSRPLHGVSLWSQSLEGGAADVSALSTLTDEGRRLAPEPRCKLTHRVTREDQSLLAATPPCHRAGYTKGQSHGGQSPTQRSLGELTSPPSAPFLVPSRLSSHPRSLLSDCIEFKTPLYCCLIVLIISALNSSSSIHISIFSVFI